MRNNVFTKLSRIVNNVESNNQIYCPDATISKIQRRDFGQSLGFGEVKLARPTTDNHALCLDLLRLGAFCKDTVDMNKLQAALAFQINGFSIIFYLMRLRHDGMYIMQEIGRVAFPAYFTINPDKKGTLKKE
ncbi:hypothetical protein BDC45DRAFT_537637 [Circinella umbellata]|nr:hypothetical protein BDC45DRAFT_537637 [Circinella umbellata]